MAPTGTDDFAPLLDAFGRASYELGRTPKTHALYDARKQAATAAREQLERVIDGAAKAAVHVERGWKLNTLLTWFADPDERLRLRSRWRTRQTLSSAPIALRSTMRSAPSQRETAVRSSGRSRRRGRTCARRGRRHRIDEPR